MRLLHHDGLAVHLEAPQRVGQQVVHPVDLGTARGTLYQDVVGRQAVVSRVRVEIAPFEPLAQGLGVVEVFGRHLRPRRKGNLPRLFNGVQLVLQPLVLKRRAVHVRHVDDRRNSVVELVALLLGKCEQDGTLERHVTEMGRLSGEVRPEIRLHRPIFLVRAQVGVDPVAHRLHLADNPPHAATAGVFHQGCDSAIVGRFRSRFGDVQRFDLDLELVDVLPPLLGCHLVLVVLRHRHPDVVASLPEVLVALLEHPARPLLPVEVRCGAKAARPIHPRPDRAETLRHVPQEGLVLLVALDGEAAALDYPHLGRHRCHRCHRQLPELICRLCDVHLDAISLVDGQDAPSTTLAGNSGGRQSQNQMTGAEEVARRPPHAPRDRVDLIHYSRTKHNP